MKVFRCFAVLLVVGLGSINFPASAGSCRVFSAFSNAHSSDAEQGKRLYLAQKVLLQLADESPNAAPSIYETILLIVLMKDSTCALHDRLNLEHFGLTEASPAIINSWNEIASRTLRLIGLGGLAPQPLLDAEESICLTCHFSAHLIAATGERAGSLVHKDTRSLESLQADIVAGNESDVTLIRGVVATTESEISGLIWLGAPNFEATRRTRGEYLEAAKAAVIAKIESDLDALQKGTFDPNLPPVSETGVEFLRPRFLNRIRLMKLSRTSGVLRIFYPELDLSQ
jgi:hypothetical protein